VGDIFQKWHICNQSPTTRYATELSQTQHHAIRIKLLNAAFDQEFSDEDNAHAYGGVRVIAVADDQIMGHAALISRTITITGTPYRVGYVEGVAVWQDFTPRSGYWQSNNAPNY
jgi:hypothetical protein